MVIMKGTIKSLPVLHGTRPSHTAVATAASIEMPCAWLFGVRAGRAKCTADHAALGA